MSTEFDRFFFYRTNQNFEEMLPYLLILGVLVIASIGTWAVYSVYSQWQAENLSWKRFHVLARRYTLNKREEAYLKQILKEKKHKTPNRILLEEDRFEGIFGPIETYGRKYDKRYIQKIRDKLFQHSLSDGEAVRSTHQLHPGTRFELCPENETYTLDCYLADVDDSGLIVIIPAAHRLSSSIRPNMYVEVIAKIKGRRPVQFNTKVKSIIPGPRNMILLSHTTYVVDVEAYTNELCSNVMNTLMKMHSSPTKMPASQTTKGKVEKSKIHRVRVA